jgi:hypothetical protein
MIYMYMSVYCVILWVFAFFVLTYKKEKAAKRKKHFLEVREEYYRQGRR